MLTFENIKNSSGYLFSANRLARSSAKPKLPAKVLKSAYYNIPGQLQASWLEHIHLKRQAKKKSQTSFSAFDAEQKLLESLFNTHKSETAADKKRILDFCSILRIRATKDAQTNPSNAAREDFLIDITKQQLAQVIFLADRNLGNTALLIDLNDIPQSLTNIQKEFEAKILNCTSSIKNHKSRHEKVPIQDSALAVSVLKPLAIANVLMSSGGLLNLGLIDSVKKYFFDYSNDLIQCERELLQTLDDIEHSTSLQRQIEGISKPHRQLISSNDLIRITLRLPPHATPTDAQARMVVLAAILSDMRQGDVGSCFGTAVAIMMMGSLKGKVISDAEQLITQGRIVRKNGSDQSDFIPVLDIGDSALQSPVSINKDGLVRIEKGNGYLWESPGIIAACKQLNIPEDKIPSVIKSTINLHYTIEKINPKKTTEISPQGLIKLLVDGISTGRGFDNQQKAELNNLASFAFSAETNTPLLRAWESCIAAMAESKTNNYVRSKILNCVSAALNDIWPKNSLKDLTDQAKKVQNVFMRVLNSSIQLRYDPQVEIKAKNTGDGHSTMLGAFVLHELEHGTQSISARLVENPAQFKTFVAKKTNLATEALEKTGGKDLNQSKAIIQNIQNYISQPDTNFSSFLKDAIRAYEDENKTIKDPLKVWEEIEHLPFRDATGDENVPVYTIATGINPGAPETVRPKDTNELLTAFILFGRSRIKPDNFIKDNDPYQRYMVDTPQHAFTLTPEDASIVDAMSSPLSPKQWIEEHIVKPGMAIASIPMSQEQKNKLIKVVCTEIVPKELITTFMNKIAAIDQNTKTYHQFSNAVLDALLTVTQRKNAKTRAAFSRKITNILLEQVFPPNVSNLLGKTAARIADTNWVNEGVRHIYFACFFDPLTKTLQLATQDEGGNRTQAVDQNEWVAYVPWEMYGVKLTPSLDDRKVHPILV